MDLKDSYNQIAEDWHESHQQDDWWTKNTDLFISFLKPGALVLDVGCGGGTKTKYLIKNGLRVIGIDFSEKMIEIARREVSSATFKIMDLSEISGLNYSFDGIFMQAVLLHIHKVDVEARLKELVKKLKKGGYLYIAVKEKKPDGVDEETVVENQNSYSYERFFSYFTADEINLYLKKIGCEIIFSEVVPSGESRWIQVVAKKSDL
jgi:2-polyprenyl-3-methyl-5-hydroxy-6-metoxy-1,4-benzoquinol methylase